MGVSFRGRFWTLEGFSVSPNTSITERAVSFWAYFWVSSTTSASFIAPSLICRSGSLKRIRTAPIIILYDNYEFCWNWWVPFWCNETITCIANILLSLDEEVNAMFNMISANLEISKLNFLWIYPKSKDEPQNYFWTRLTPINLLVSLDSQLIWSYVIPSVIASKTSYELLNLLFFMSERIGQSSWLWTVDCRRSF